ncbi:hypothetical protein DPF_2654 [Desulfoplanes formicivorans]|uniref:Uncharacterized protein n=1 Tax=Desulfoplanes formicivorans TaxID=1592317 RepID=A0A194AKS7_9BACT|nr:hypothetical protein DPF_2654 [Desulfoplanes formicivorans]
MLAVMCFGMFVHPVQGGKLRVLSGIYRALLAGASLRGTRVHWQAAAGIHDLLMGAYLALGGIDGSCTGPKGYRA